MQNYDAALAKPNDNTQPLQRPDDDRLVTVHHRRMMQNYDTALAKPNDNTQPLQRPDDDRLVKVHHRRMIQNYDTAPANLVTTRNDSRDQMMIDLCKSITEEWSRTMTLLQPT